MSNVIPLRPERPPHLQTMIIIGPVGDEHRVSILYGPQHLGGDFPTRREAVHHAKNLAMQHGWAVMDAPHIRLWEDGRACGFGGIVVQVFGIPELAGRRAEFFVDQHEDALFQANEWARELGSLTGRRCNILDELGSLPGDAA